MYVRRRVTYGNTSFYSKSLILKLRAKVNTCEFGSAEATLLSDSIIIGGSLQWRNLHVSMFVDPNDQVRLKA
jgi:hypothetical protein